LEQVLRRRALRGRHLPPVPRAVALLLEGDRRAHHRRGRQRGILPRGDRRRPPPVPHDRQRAQLRSDVPARCGGAAGVPGIRGHPMIAVPHLLTWLIFLPAAGAALLAFFPARAAVEAKTAGVVVSLATFILSLGLWRYDPAVAAFQFGERARWVP